MNHDMHSSKLEKKQLTGQISTGAAKPKLFSSLYKFKDVEDVIQLAHCLPMPFLNTKLFAFEGNYYLTVIYPDQRSTRGQDWGESIVMEFGERTQMSIHAIIEYGQMIMSENAIGTLRRYFTRSV